MPLMLGKPQHVALAILVGATTATAGARAAPVDAAESSPLPPQRSSVNTTVFLPALGYVRSSTFGASLDLVDVELAVGYGYQHGAFGLDLGGGFAGVFAGQTEAGRSMHGLLMEPLILMFHWEWFRFGLGAGIGALSAKRATNGEAQSDGWGAVWGAIGAEPLGPSGRPVFIEARAGLMAWGEPAPMFSLAIGMRGCLLACR
jgi:hypothetical protein